MKIGILALQGAFLEHFNMLNKLNASPFYIKSYDSLNEPLDGIIIPGGESTTMIKLLKDFNMQDKLRSLILDGLPVFGTCAGLVLLSKCVNSNEEGSKLGTMDIYCKRNGYGRQINSFIKKINFKEEFKIDGVFIRAPLIFKVSNNVEILAKLDGNIVAARQKNQLVTSFHPELTGCCRVHEYFLDMINSLAQGNR